MKRFYYSAIDMTNYDKAILPERTVISSYSIMLNMQNWLARIGYIVEMAQFIIIKRIGQAHFWALL